MFIFVVRAYTRYDVRVLHARCHADRAAALRRWPASVAAVVAIGLGHGAEVGAVSGAGEPVGVGVEDVVDLLLDPRVLARHTDPELSSGPQSVIPLWTAVYTKV